MTKAAPLLLCLLGLSAAAAASSDKKHNNKNKVAGDADKRKLFQDDENFWTRFVQEVSSSSLTAGPTPEPTPGPTPFPTTPPQVDPTPEPTPAPTPEPSTAPTDFCETEVRIRKPSRFLSMPGIFINS